MFTDKLEKVCIKNDFFIDKKTSEEPDVILLKDTYYDNKSWNAGKIERILEVCLQSGDSLRISEVEGKVIVPGYDIIGSGIFGCLHDLKVDIYGNDSYQAVRWQKAATMWLHFATKAGPSELVLKAMDDIEEARKFRSQSIIKGPFGLAKAQGRRYQVVTDDRINAILQPYLQQF